MSLFRGFQGVAYFTDTLYEVNGVSLTARRLFEYARRRGYPLALYAPPPAAGQEALRGATILRPYAAPILPWYPDLHLSFPSLVEVVQHLQRQRAQLVHAATPGPVGWTARAAARLLRLPFSAAYHTRLPQYAATLTGRPMAERAGWAFMRAFYGKAEVVLAPSRETADELVAHGLSEKRMAVFRRGVDTSLFTPFRRDPDFWPARGAPRGVPVVLYVGRVSREKCLDDLAAVAARVNGVALAGSPAPAPSSGARTGGDERPLRAVFAVVGAGPYLEELKASGAPGLLTTGWMQGEELAAAYASADLFYFPSTSDTFGNVVVEAMASGLPCLVTDRGGPRELVADGRQGLVLPARQVDAAAAAIARLLDDRTERRRMAREALEAGQSRTLEEGLEEMWQILAGVAGLAGAVEAARNA